MFLQPVVDTTVYAGDIGADVANNGHTDVGHPELDDSSPGYPPSSAYSRNVDNSCYACPPRPTVWSS